MRQVPRSVAAAWAATRNRVGLVLWGVRNGGGVRLAGVAALVYLGALPAIAEVRLLAYSVIAPGEGGAPRRLVLL